MRYVLKLSAVLACVCALAGSGEAAAKSRRQVQHGSVAAASGDDFPIPLPENLTSNKDFLDDGAAAEAAANKRPNARANDNYFLEQQDFAAQDPLRYTEAGSLFDQFQ